MSTVDFRSRQGIAKTRGAKNIFRNFVSAYKTIIGFTKNELNY